MKFDGRFPQKASTTLPWLSSCTEAQEERLSGCSQEDDLSISRGQFARIANEYGNRKGGMQAGPTILGLSAFLVTSADVSCHILHGS